MITDTFNLSVCPFKELETSALGLACLTAIRLAMYKDFDEAVSRVENQKIEKIHPNPSNIARYNEVLDGYKRIEMDLETFFQPVSG